MRGKVIFLLAAGFGLIISGCNPRAAILPGNNHYDVTLSNHAFSPDLWRVPGGEQITFTIDNRDENGHDFTILLRPAELPFSSEDKINVYFSQELEAGRTTGIEFIAPQAPGEYSVLSTLPGDAEAGLIGTLVVVQLENQN